jgi:hypothetical protein
MINRVNEKILVTSLHRYNIKMQGTIESFGEQVEMAMNKYPPGISTLYLLTIKNNSIGSLIYTSGYGFTPISIGSPVPTKIKHLSKYYIIQISSISI